MNKNILKIIEYPEKGILSKQIIKNEKQDATLFCMAAGTEIDKHTSTKQGSIFVLEGQGVFNLQGKNIEMKPGVFIFMDKNAKHLLKASKNTSFILNLIK